MKGIICLFWGAWARPHHSRRFQSRVSLCSDSPRYRRDRDTSCPTLSMDDDWWTRFPLTWCRHVCHMTNRRTCRDPRFDQFVTERWNPKSAPEMEIMTLSVVQHNDDVFLYANESVLNYWLSLWCRHSQHFPSGCVINHSYLTTCRSVSQGSEVKGQGLGNRLIGEN